MQIEQVKLKNNLNVLFVNSPGATSGSAQIWFRAGSALENQDNEGIAHFLEHMFFKGTLKRPGAKIAHDVESFGGEINAFTSFDYTCYYINSPVNHLNESVEILLDMVSHPQFLQTELEPERDVVFEEYRRSLDNPGQFNFREMQKQSFENGYAHPILGREDTIKNFSIAQLKEFREKFYNINNAMLLIAGDIKDRLAVEALIESFPLPKGKVSEFPEFTLKKSNSFSTHTKEVKQAVLTLAIEAPHFVADETPAEDLALNCLGHGETSRLYKSLITDSPIASSVSASSMFFCKGGSHFIRVALPEKNIENFMKKFLVELKNLYTQSLLSDEITKIKNQYVASKVYERESIESFSFSLGHGFAQTGDIHCEALFIKKIKDTTIQEVNDAFIRIFERPIHATAQLPKDTKVKNLDKTLKKFVEDIQKLAVSAKKIKKQDASLVVSEYDPAVKSVQLKKGMTFIYRQNTMTPTFVLHSFVKGGQAAETSANSGLYQMLARSITYGYKGTSYDELREDLETKSAYFNGFSGKNAFGLNLHGQTEHFDDLLDHFFGTLIHPEFQNKYINLEREMIYRSIENQKEDPVKQCFRSFNKIVFNQHPYSMDLHGTKETLKKINPALLTRTHLKHIQTSEMVITYCGDKGFDEVFSKVNDFTKKLKDRKKTVQKKNKIKPLTGKNDSIKMSREQTHIMIGTTGYKNGLVEDLYLKMLTTHLSGQSSELFVEVRDRQGLCYSVQPIHHSALEAGYWGIYIGAGHDKKEKAIQAILNIIAKIGTNGFTEEEFQRIKKMIDGQNQVNIQTNDDYANLYSIPVLHGMGLDFQHKSFEAIRNFSSKDFNAFLKEFLDLKKKWTRVEVGP